jgi:hypothetical protein
MDRTNAIPRPDPTASLVEDLARAIFTFARHRPGRLAAVSVRVPPETVEIRDLLAERLEEYGISGATVHVQLRPGPASLVSVEYER